MKLLNLIKSRYKYHIGKKKEKSNLYLIIEKHKLNNHEEQVSLVNQFNLIQQKKSLLSKKKRDEVESKIYFMIQNKILEVKI